MTIIPLSTIQVDDSTRFRGAHLEEGSLLELVESIKSVGLIEPIVVDYQYNLLAGRRRLEALKRLGWTELEYGKHFKYMEELDELSKKIVEYDENSKRLALTWQEDAVAIAEIHKLLVAKKRAESTFAQSTTPQSRQPLSTYGEGVIPPVKATATALGVSEGKITYSLQLAKAVENKMERVLSHPTQKGALLAYKRERELELTRELARRRTKTTSIQGGTVLSGGVLYNADCREILPTLEENSVDLILMDPPWGVNVDTASAWAKKWIHSYEDKPDDTKEMLHEVFPMLFRILKPTCLLYTFYGIADNEWWIKELVDAGFMVRKRPLIWFKLGQPSIADTYAAFLSCYEPMLFAWKPGEGGIRRLFSKPIPEGWGELRPSLEERKWHENTKPSRLLWDIIEASSDIDDVVLDPFCGGGSTLRAATFEARMYIGIEKDQAMFEGCRSGMSEVEERHLETEKEVLDEESILDSIVDSESSPSI